MRLGRLGHGCDVIAFAVHSGCGGVTFGGGAVHFSRLGVGFHFHDVFLLMPKPLIEASQVQTSGTVWCSNPKVAAYTYTASKTPLARQQHIRFLNAIERQVPTVRDIQVILDIVRPKSSPSGTNGWTVKSGSSDKYYRIALLNDRRRSHILHGRMARIRTARRMRILETKPGRGKFNVPYQVPGRTLRHVPIWMRQDADLTSLV